MELDSFSETNKSLCCEKGYKVADPREMNDHTGYPALAVLTFKNPIYAVHLKSMATLETHYIVHRV